MGGEFSENEAWSQQALWAYCGFRASLKLVPGEYNLNWVPLAKESTRVLRNLGRGELDGEGKLPNLILVEVLVVLEVLGVLGRPLDDDDLGAGHEGFVGPDVGGHVDGLQDLYGIFCGGKNKSGQN